jgi:nicotinate-nucleotide adenylyltransferase
MSADTKTKRVGIYAGVFNPVHAGHIAFALQALEAAKLDAIYFVPERRPRQKQAVEHFGHRVAMIRQALRPHPKLGVIELEDVSFSVKRTIPRLQKRLPNRQLVFLFGSDAVANITQWPHFETLLTSNELVVGVREQDEQATVQAVIDQWLVQPKAVQIFPSYAGDISSRAVRAGLERRQYVQGLLSSVWRYSDQHWLYVSLLHSATTKR